VTLPAITRDTCIVRMMAAARERGARQCGVANVQCESAAIPTGLDEGR